MLNSSVPDNLKTNHICTVQLNANLITARGLQVENAQVNVHTREGKDQGVRHGFSPTGLGQPPGIKLWRLFVTSFFNALILTIILAADVISFIHSSLKNP